MIPDLTLEKLVIIVAETVEQVMSRQRLLLAAYAFNDDSREELSGLMSSFNDNGEIYTAALPTNIPDVFFVDVIPAGNVAKLALGIGEEGFTDFFNRVLWAGKKIIVIRREKLENPAVGPLFECYYKMLEGYGVLFMDSTGKSLEAAGQNTSQCVDKGFGQSNVYRSNVLSKKDLIENVSSGKFFITPQVVVTGLAKEEAARMGIDLIVVEGC